MAQAKLVISPSDPIVAAASRSNDPQNPGTDGKWNTVPPPARARSPPRRGVAISATGRHHSTAAFSLGPISSSAASALPAPFRSPWPRRVPSGAAPIRSSSSSLAGSPPLRLLPKSVAGGRHLRVPSLPRHEPRTLLPTARISGSMFVSALRPAPPPRPELVMLTAFRP